MLPDLILAFIAVFVIWLGSWILDKGMKFFNNKN